jgi:hypothetical protein
LAEGAPTSGSSITSGGAEWLVLQFADGTGYLKRDAGQWRLTAASRGPLTIFYSDFTDGRADTIGIRSAANGRLTADIRLRLSDIDTNVTLDPRAFTIELPEHPVPLTLEELRRAGPMGDGQ